MVKQLKVIQTDKCKGKSASKTQEAIDELDYLVTFNRSITQGMARTMQDMSQVIFINMANLTSTHCHSYVNYLKARINQDTFTALRKAPLHIREVKAKLLTVTVQGSQFIHSYCLNVARDKVTVNVTGKIETLDNLHVNLPVVNHILIAGGQPQKKCISYCSP